MDRPTAADLRANPRLEPFLVASGFLAPAPGGTDPLDEEILLAWSYVEKRTCRDLDLIEDEAEAAIARRAVVLRIIQQAVQEGTDYAAGTMDDLIKSFAVPGYSETRRDGAVDIKSSWMLNPMPALHDLLRALVTDECWDKWLIAVQGPGSELPFSMVTEFDWHSTPYRLI